MAFSEGGMIIIDVDESKSIESETIISVYIEATPELEWMARNSEQDWSVHVWISPTIFPIVSRSNTFALNEIFTGSFFMTSINSMEIARTYQCPCILLSVHAQVIFKNNVMYTTIYHLGFNNDGKNLLLVDSSDIYECVRLNSHGYEGEYIDYIDDPYQKIHKTVSEY